MAFKPTIEQKAAIETKGNVLVAAAAGSGKTAVLVERVISMLCSKENPISADKLLIVTFTNAAAAEMRLRIERRLDEEILQNPNDVALLQQKYLLGNAKICTIDSFCIDLVRENFERAGVAPDFKISDGSELEKVNRSVLSEIVNGYFVNENQDFFNLLDFIGAEYDEQNFIDFVLDIYEYSRQLPFPKLWFGSFEAFYKDFNKENLWWQYCFSTARKLTKSALDTIDIVLDSVSQNETASMEYASILNGAKNKINNLAMAANGEDWDKFYNEFCAFEMPALHSVRSLSKDENIARAKNVYKLIGEKYFSRLEKLFFATSTEISSQFSLIYPSVRLLSEILNLFEDKVFDAYKEINTFTFHNTEHLALSLLCYEKNGEIYPREDSEDLLERFSEILVDEYQDTNNLQDILFKILSGNEQRLFVVGDVKQSIYGFRGANPKNFLLKKNTYKPLGEATDGLQQKIILGKNFRSCEKVCDFINYFFGIFLNEQTGDIVYNDDERLIPGAVFPQTNTPAVQVDVLLSEKKIIEDAILEANHIADYILDTMSQGDIIRKNDNTLRKARFSDFAILLRSANIKAPVLTDVLKQRGIPVNFSGTKFSERQEIATVLSLLSVIDNPRNDIDLICVMLSPIFDFTVDDLAIIRANSQKGSFYSAVIESANLGDAKSQNFLNKLDDLRRKSIVTPLAKFISTVLFETNYLNAVTLLPDGKRRRSNLQLLCEIAEQFSVDMGGSIKSFIKFVLKNTASQGSAVQSSTAVNIMSIHASKGLQFPVCIVASCASRFSDQESAQSTLFDAEYGIGFKYFDETLKTKLTTVSREVLLDKVRAERIEEELRLFYVALTRAQDKLYLVGTVANIDRKLREINCLIDAGNGKMNFSNLQSTKSYLDWLLIATLLHPKARKVFEDVPSLHFIDNGCDFSVNIKNAGVFTDLDAETCKEKEITLDTQLADKVKKNANFRYPFEAVVDIQSKTSVTGLIGSAESIKYAFSSKPSFMIKDGKTAAQKGTATHKVMQFFDFAKSDSIDEEIQRLTEWQYISEEDAKSVDKDAIENFFRSDVFDRILKASILKREMRFITEIDANLVDATLESEFGDEKIIVQGAIDLCFVENGELVILDFKTDRVNDLEHLRKTYAPQLELYAMACKKIFNMPIKEKIIYSFFCGKEIKV